MNETMKQRFITAYMLRYGCSKRVAKKAWARMDDAEKLMPVILFEDNARHEFARREFYGN